MPLLLLPLLAVRLLVSLPLRRAPVVSSLVAMAAGLGPVLVGRRRH